MQNSIQESLKTMKGRKEACAKSKHWWTRFSVFDQKDSNYYAIRCSRCLDVVLSSQILFAYKTY